MDSLENKPTITYLAETNFRNQRRRFGIKADDRRRHMYLIGKTGMGKSTAMENMIIQDIVNGHGVALVDPHGDFAEKILDYVPSYRVNDVIYFNPADIEYPISFNVMESVSQEHRHLIASGLVGVFKKLWADSWGPRLEYILRNTILALLDYPSSTLLGVMRMLVDKSFRKKVVEKVKDPVVKAFWVQEFSRYSEKFANEAIAPIQNKIGQFLSTALIRNIVGQVKSSIDMRDIMDNQKILLMNLSKGRVGEDASALLGAMMITKLQLAAMSRIDTLEDDRRDFYLYVDEFQNFATESFASILSEARKYRLNLIIAHQYIEQLEETVRAAVFGNVGTIMCFRVGAGDAEFLVKEFSPYFTEEDIVNLAKYDTYMKLMIDGIASNPFSATTLPPFATNKKTNNREKIINSSRERYAQHRDVVEDKISRWSGVMDDEEEQKKSNTIHLRKENSKPSSSPNIDTTEERKSSRSKNKKDKVSRIVNCYECGKETEINFIPDGVRPVYCPECFKKVREQQEPNLKDAEEVIPEAKEAISLSEALGKEPVDFKGKRIDTDKESKSQKPAQKSSPEPQKTTAESQPQNKQSHHSKTLLPGKVVKF